MIRKYELRCENSLTPDITVFAEGYVADRSNGNNGIVFSRVNKVESKHEKSGVITRDENNTVTVTHRTIHSIDDVEVSIVSYGYRIFYYPSDIKYGIATRQLICDQLEDLSKSMNALSDEETRFKSAYESANRKRIETQSTYDRLRKVYADAGILVLGDGENGDALALPENL